MTLTTSTERSQEVDHRNAEESEAISIAPVVVRVLPLITLRLSERHPAIPTAVVDRHVRAAAILLTSEARIHDFLPILIERRASASLARDDG